MHRSFSVFSGLLAAIALLLAVAAPAVAQQQEDVVPLHQAVKEGLVQIRTEHTHGYQGATVRITNTSDRPITIEPVGSGLIPTETTDGKYTQRLALMGDLIRLSQRGVTTVRFRTCCMDLGKPAPTTAAPYTDVQPVDPRIQQAMEYWRAHPEISQDPVNRVVWGMYTLDVLKRRFEEGNCRTNPPGFSDAIESNYPPEAVEWHAEQERFIEEAEDMVKRSTRTLTWTELLQRPGAGEGEGEGSLEGDTDGEGEGEGDADSDADGDSDADADETPAGPPDLGKELQAQFEKAKKDAKVVVLFVYTDGSGDYKEIREACVEFEYAVLRDEKVFEALQDCVRLKVDIAEVSRDMARANGLHGRRAPQLMIYDYEGKLRYRVQTSRATDALNKISRVREINERMFKRAND